MSQIPEHLIGTETEPFLVEVEKGAIAKFAEAIGDLSPLYLDEAFARTTPHGGLIAPPTFPITFRPPEEPEWARGLDYRRILHGSQEFEYHRPIRSGERLWCTMRLAAVETKSGRTGKMDLITRELRGADASGNPVFVGRGVIVYRYPAEA